MGKSSAAIDEEQHARWKRESETVPIERVREIVTREMWEYEAENECVRRFGISLEAAIYFVSRAEREGLIGMSLGHVRPEVEPCTCPNMPCPRRSG